MSKPVDMKLVGWLLLMLLVALVFWDWAFMYPIKVFVVLLHEIGHGLAAVATGGEMIKIELSSDLGGVCWSRGGWRLVVLPAGYLGSMLFGGLILVSAARTRYDRQIAMGIGVMVVLITLLFVRTMFGVAFGLVFGALMVASGKYLPEEVNDLLLKFLGLTSSLYAIFDIKDDLISRTVPGSDAYAMSQELFLPPVFWGVLWIIIAVVVSGWLFVVASRGESATPPGSQPPPKK